MIAEISGLTVGPAHGAPIVDGAGLTIAEGEIVALIGASGAGKTTLALTLLGHLRPGLTIRAGTVRVAGTDPFGPGGRALRGGVVSFLGQDPAAALNPARRIGAQLAEAAGPGRVAELLAAMDLPTGRAFTRRRPYEISGGQAQRVALAIAVAGHPRLLVLDEPTSGLDRPLAADLRDRLAAYLHDRGCAALLVTHDTALAGRLAGRVVRLGTEETVTPVRPVVTTPGGRVLRVPAEEMVTAVRPVVSTPGGGVLRVPAGETLTPAPPVVSTPAGAVLRVRDLCAGYGRRVVVDGVSFDVAAGGCTALAGPSGAGKSTIARSVAGLTARRSGRIILDGADLAPAVRQRTLAQRRAVQLVGQDSVGALNPRETALQALRRPLTAHHPADVDARAAELLRRVRLPGSAAHRRPGELSGGERQRLNLARALAAAPRVLVCDEITSALDRGTAHAVLDLLAELRERHGIGVLMVSHDPDVVARAAQHVVEIPHPHTSEEHRT